jgi:hypothetical protein
VALLAIVATVSLSGGKAYASGTNCGSGTDGLSEICMYIDGYSNVVVAAVSEVTITSPKGIGEYDIGNQWINFPGHIQIVNPAGLVPCRASPMSQPSRRCPDPPIKPDRRPAITTTDEPRRRT